MLRADLPKENVDGEAIEWAVRRLRAGDRTHKVLLVLSDGAPCDDSTMLANDVDYLMNHLRVVLTELQAASDIAVGAIAIGFPGYAEYPRSVTIKEPEDLGEAMLSLLKDCLTDLAEASTKQLH